jgi:hypothetical protein
MPRPCWSSRVPPERSSFETAVPRRRSSASLSAFRGGGDHSLSASAAFSEPFPEGEEQKTGQLARTACRRLRRPVSSQTGTSRSRSEFPSKKVSDHHVGKAGTPAL